MTGCVEIQSAAWFDRPDFQQWRQTSPHGPATWGPFDQDGDMIDVFMTFDFDRRTGFWEGSDSDDLPEDIYFQIAAVLKQHREDHGVIWLKPT